MQFQVPQFIDNESKVVGPLSLRQFFLLAGPISLAFVFFIILPLWLWIFAALFLTSLGAGLAFGKVGGIPIPKLIVSGFHFVWNPQTYVWQPNQPNLPKDPETMQSLGLGDKMGKIMAGVKLKNAWRNMQTASPEKKNVSHEGYEQSERYSISRRTAGDLRASKRVDYS